MNLPSVENVAQPSDAEDQGVSVDSSGNPVEPAVVVDEALLGETPKVPEDANLNLFVSSAEEWPDTVGLIVGKLSLTYKDASAEMKEAPKTFLADPIELQDPATAEAAIRKSLFILKKERAPIVTIPIHSFRLEPGSILESLSLTSYALSVASSDSATFYSSPTGIRLTWKIGSVMVRPGIKMDVVAYLGSDPPAEGQIDWVDAENPSKPLDDETAKRFRFQTSVIFFAPGTGADPCYFETAPSYIEGGKLRVAFRPGLDAGSQAAILAEVGLPSTSLLAGEDGVTTLAVPVGQECMHERALREIEDVQSVGKEFIDVEKLAPPHPQIVK